MLIHTLVATYVASFSISSRNACFLPSRTMYPTRPVFRGGAMFQMSLAGHRPESLPQVAEAEKTGEFGGKPFLSTVRAERGHPSPRGGSKVNK